MKNILAGIFVSLFSVLVALFLFEAGFRLVSGGKAKAQWSDRPAEYFIHEESRTFQDYPHQAEKPEGVYRVAVIGDSFTFAPYMQFDDAFPKRLERYLNLNAHQKKVEVTNYGVPAYSTSHEVPVVERAIKEGADFIIMQITFNDPEIKPYTPTQLFRERNRFGELELKNPIFHYWKSLAFVLRRIHNTQTYNNYVQKFFDLFEKPRTWGQFKGSWEKIQAVTSHHNVPAVAVVFPLFGIPLDQEYPFHPIHKKVKDLMGSLGIPSHDLFKDFEGIPLDRMQVIVGHDFHPNEICHRLAAESILRWAKEQNLPIKQFIPRYSFKERVGIKLPHVSYGKNGDEQVNLPVKEENPSVNDEGEELLPTPD